MTEHLFPQRTVITRQDGIVPEWPGECELECRESDKIRATFGYQGYSEYLEMMSATRDERQCRGCGRWGIFEPRSLPAPKPCRCCNGDPLDHGNCTCREPCAWEECPARPPVPVEAGAAYARPVDGSGPWRRIGRVAEHNVIVAGVRGVPGGPAGGD